MYKAGALNVGGTVSACHLGSLTPQRSLPESSNATTKFHDFP